MKHLTSLLGALLLTLLALGSAEAASNILNWADNSGGETGFEIWKKTDISTACTGTTPAFTLLTTVAANIVTFTDAAVVDGTTYCYEVRAINATTQSAFSNVAGRFIPLTAPSGLAVTAGP